MKIRNILIEDKVKEKILFKHKVTAFEIKMALLNNPLILKTRKNRYLAIGKDQRYITIIFEFLNNTAFIATAFPSSESQRKLFKLKRE